MLVLTFWLGEDRFALRSSAVRRVVPLPILKTLPRAPEWVSGVFNYRGKTAPVIDLSVVMNGTPCERKMSTRLIMVNYRSRRDQGEQRVMGLMAERVMETLKISEDTLDSAGIAPETAPWLDRIAHLPDGMLQLVNADKLLPPEIRAILFPDSDSEDDISPDCAPHSDPTPVTEPDPGNGAETETGNHPTPQETAP